MESFVENTLGKYGQKNGQTNPGKHLESFSWSQTIKFKITSLQKSAGKQSHKGGRPQEAQILFNAIVLGASLVSNWFWGLLKKRSWQY